MQVSSKVHLLLHFYMIDPAGLALLDQRVSKLMEALCGHCINPGPHLPYRTDNCQQRQLMIYLHVACKAVAGRVFACSELGLQCIEYVSLVHKMCLCRYVDGICQVC